MFIYDSLFLICCCLGAFVIILLMLVIIFAFGGKRNKRTNEFREKLEKFKQKKKSEYKSDPAVKNAEDAEFREVK